MLLSAGCVIAHLRGRSCSRTLTKHGLNATEHGFKKNNGVQCERCNVRSLFAIGGVIGQQMTVVLHHHCAARGIDKYGLKVARLQQRPPSVNVATDLIQCAVSIGKMMPNRPAAARALHNSCLNLKRIKHTCCCQVNVREKAWLNTAIKQNNFTSMALRRPGSAWALTHGQLACKKIGKKRFKATTQLSCRGEKGRA